MPRFMKKRGKTVGLSPGTPVHVGEKKVEKIRIRIIDYDEKHIEEKEVQSIEECIPLIGTHTVTWVNIDGLHDISVIEKIGKHFEIHPLVLEDIANTGQRPKMEDFERYVFVVLKMLYYDKEKEETHAEQFSLILGPNWVITFQERVGDVFEPVRERLRKGKGRIRKSGPDYLAYALIDAVVDNYFGILEHFGETIENMEEELVADPTPQTLQAIHTLKRELIFLRKSIWPLREVISGLEREELSLVKEATGVYLRDVHDHTIQVIDTIETFRDMVSGMLDIYLSSMSNRMNEVMKVLTLIATIFIPTTFLAGIYGMNFEYMPELKWKFSYPLFWVAVLLVGSIMGTYFKRKKWL
jgi:magnesium transporter